MWASTSAASTLVVFVGVDVLVDVGIYIVFVGSVGINVVSVD